MAATQGGAPAPGPLSARAREAADRLIGRYPHPRSALLPLLYLVQAEHGAVTREGMGEVAEMLGLSKAEVAAVATFYTMFKRHGCGTYLVSVCTNVSCALAGGQRLYERLSADLGVEDQGTTLDGRVTLESVECLAACDGAPVVQVNYENYERLTEEGASELVGRLRAGEEPPPPTRGETPRPSAEVHWRLSCAEAP